MLLHTVEHLKVLLQKVCSSTACLVQNWRWWAFAKSNPLLWHFVHLSICLQTKPSWSEIDSWKWFLDFKDVCCPVWDLIYSFTVHSMTSNLWPFEVLGLWWIAVNLQSTNTVLIVTLLVTMKMANGKNIYPELHLFECLWSSLRTAPVWHCDIVTLRHRACFPVYDIMTLPTSLLTAAMQGHAIMQLLVAAQLRTCWPSLWKKTEEEGWWMIVKDSAILQI